MEAPAPNPYNEGLDRNPANFQPLTPLTFLERAGTVFPEHTAIVHGSLRRSYAEFYRRSRQLASALAAMVAILLTMRRERRLARGGAGPL